MATQAVFQDRRNDLSRLVRGWDRRLRLQQAAMWLPRALVPGLLTGIVLAIVSRLRPLYLSDQIALITGLLLALGVSVMLLIVWLWPRPQMVAARRFDVTFGLGERVSTAFELIEGRIHTVDELTALQVDDAWAKARGVRAGEMLPLVWRWREWSGVLLFAAILLVLLIIPNPQATAVAADVAQQAAITAAAEELRQITEDVAADAALEPEDREQLLQALQASKDVLEQPNVTPEEAFAALTDAQASLQQQSEEMSQQAGAQQSALASASESLQQAQTGSEAGGEQPGEISAAESLQNLSDQIPSMNAAQQQALAQAMQQAAQELQSTNPAAAEALQQAADALQNGDMSGAQEAMQEAAQEMADAQQSAQSQSSSAEQLNQSAQSAQEAAEQVSQQSQGNAQQNQQQSQGNPQSGEESQQSSEQENGQQGQGQQPGEAEGSGEQTGQQQASPGEGQQPGEQPGQGGEGQSNQPSDQAGEGGQASDSSGGGSSPQQEGESSESLSNVMGGGAGDSPGGAGSEQNTSGSPAGGGAQQDNNPDGTGEGEFDPIYAPQRIGGESDQEIQLEPDASDAPLQEGDFAQNPTGNASVPYNQVFSDYSNAANRALESDYIPLGLRDVVRDYFSSLEPGQNSNGGQP